ncbi:MAG: LysR family transcriptional regulator [Pseudomonadota bacterium]
MGIILSSNYLEAFLALCKTLNFTKAAESIFITQSALSQRIKALEDQLEHTLFIREPSDISLTEAGKKLLTYCLTKEKLEQEFLNDFFNNDDKELAGSLRIGSYSSIFRSVIIPALAPLIRKNPKIHCEFICKPMAELPDLLKQAKVDYIIMDYVLEKTNIKSHFLGNEEYVVISCKKQKTPPNIFLDNNPEDKATSDFFATQKDKKFKYERSFMSDCYGILDGVKNGLGKAVIPIHLVNEKHGIKIEKKYNKYKLDVTLHHFEQPYYTRLHDSFIETLVSNSNKFL